MSCLAKGKEGGSRGVLRVTPALAYVVEYILLTGCVRGADWLPRSAASTRNNGPDRWHDKAHASRGSDREMVTFHRYPYGLSCATQSLGGLLGITKACAHVASAYAKAAAERVYWLPLVADILSSAGSEAEQAPRSIPRTGFLVIRTTPLVIFSTTILDYGKVR